MNEQLPQLPAPRAPRMVLGWLQVHLPRAQKSSLSRRGNTSLKSCTERVNAMLDVCVSLAKRTVTEASVRLKAGEAADAADLN